MSDTYGTFEVINIEAEAEKSMEIHGNCCTLPIISCSNQNDSIIAVGDSEHKNFKPVEIEKNQYRVVEIGKSRSGTTRKLNSLWNYFGLAERENSASSNNKSKDKKNNRKYLSSSSSSSNQDRILCLLCYTNDIIHVYMKTTASGNLWRHLNKIHGIPIPKNGKISRTPINIRKTKLIQNLLNNTHEIKNASSMYHHQNEMTTTINNEDDNNICNDEDYIIPISISTKVNNDDDKLNLSSSTTDSNISSITYLSSQDIGSILIEEVAKRPDLYTMNHDSGKKILRDRLWKEIYESTGKVMSIEQLQKMWRNIRDRYRKIRNSEKNGLTNTGQKYKYYNKLKFLDSNIDDLQYNIKEQEEQLCESYSLHHKKNKSFLISQIDNDQDEQHSRKKLKVNYHENETIMEDIDNNYSQDEEYLENSQQNIDFINNNDNDNDNENDRVIMINSNDNYEDIKHKIDTNVDVEQMISPSMLPSTLKICNCDCNRQDEFDIFGKFIAQKLRKYSKSISSEIEIKILQLLNNTTDD